MAADRSVGLCLMEFYKPFLCVDEASIVISLPGSTCSRQCGFTSRHGVIYDQFFFLICSGAFIDQSQSLNIHIARPSYANITSMHFYGWKKVCSFEGAIFLCDINAEHNRFFVLHDFS